MSEPQPLMNDNFQTLLWNRNEFVKRLSEDKDLVKCLICNDRDFEQYTLSDNELENLDFNYIYPCLYTFNTIQEIKSMITMGFEYTKSSTANIWKVGSITFYCFCHKDIAKTNYGLRYDYMLQKINDLIFNTRNDTWIGKLEFVGMKDIIMDGNHDYVGVMVRYRSTELM